MTLLLLLGCSGTATPVSDDTVAACLVEGDRPAGWGEETHSNDADPDYDVAFDRTSVLEVTVTVAAEDLAAMYVELEELLGSAFGEGGRGGQGGGPVEGMPDPQAAADACLDLAEGDACSVEVDGVEVDGTCSGLGPGGELGCVPEGVDPTGDGEGGAELDFTGDDPSYVEATVTAGDDTWCHAGMRFKGNSTLSQAWTGGVEKLPFRLDFDRFEDEHPEVDDQRFHGFSDLSFGNNLGDATVVRDVMASVVLEDRGVPAARNRFAAVWLDAGEGPVYLGLYTMAEDPSDALLDRGWGDDDGNLYEGDGACGDLTCYESDSFESKTNDDADGAEIRALVDALDADRTDAEAWRGGLEETLDVDAFLLWLAVNAALENWDAYGVMAHNYYLYAVPGDDGRLAWIPWDHNFSMMDAMMGDGDPLYADVGEDWPLIRHVLDDEVYAQAYLDALTTAMEGAWEEETFDAQAESYRALVEPYVLDERAESTFVGSEEAWDDAWDQLYEHNADRREEVRALLELP